MLPFLKDEIIVSGVTSTKEGNFKCFVVQSVSVNSNSKVTIHREESIRMIVYINIKVSKMKFKNKKLPKLFIA